jgi:hypothetical protein
VPDSEDSGEDERILNSEVGTATHFRFTAKEPGTPGKSPFFRRWCQITGRTASRAERDRDTRGNFRGKLCALCVAGMKEVRTRKRD